MFQGLQSGCVLPQMLSFRDVLEIPLTDEQIKNPQVPDNLDLLRAERMICCRWIMFPSFEVSHALTWDDLGILDSVVNWVSMTLGSIGCLWKSYDVFPRQSSTARGASSSGNQGRILQRPGIAWRWLDLQHHSGLSQSSYKMTREYPRKIWCLSVWANIFWLKIGFRLD